MPDLPPPLTPPDCDLRDFQRMMIDITRLRQSSFDSIIDDAAWRAGINLWFSAWHSVPAGSLADDDASLVKAAGLGRDLRQWHQIREVALRGFVACSDGRLYHRTVCEFALEAWIEKLKQRLISGAGNAKRWKSDFDPAPIERALIEAADLLSELSPQSKALAKVRGLQSQRESRRDENNIPPGSNEAPGGMQAASREDRKLVPSGSLETGTGTGTGISDDDADASSPRVPARAKRLPDDWQPELLGSATVAGQIAASRGEPWLRRSFETFANHWRAAAGRSATKADWQATWANWVIEQDRRDGSKGNAVGMYRSTRRSDEIDDAAAELGFCG